MKHLITLFLLPLAFQADAATYYYSRCDTGAHASCVAGSDANAGTDPAAPKLTFPTTYTATNSYRLARGGAWTGLGSPGLSAGTSKATPITVEDYTPTGCTGDCASQKPILVFTGSGFRFTEGGNADHDEGYALRNLDLRGAGYQASCNTTTGYVASTYGVYGYNDADYVTMSGLVINGFAIGINISSANTPNPGANTTQDNWIIRDTSVCNNSSMGILGSGPRLLVENSTFDNNGHGGSGAASSPFDHNVYIGITGQSHSGVIIRGNTLTRNSVRGTGPSCTSVSLVAHGSMPDLTVEGNTIVDTTSETGCWGIALNGVTSGSQAQDFSRLLIRNNVVVLDGLGNEGINCTSCRYALIENNTVVRLGASEGFTGIDVGAYASTPAGSVAEGYAIVRNNSVYIATTATNVTGIHLGDNTQNDGGQTVVGNMIYFAAGVSATPKCFAFGAGRAIGTFGAFNYNQCYRASAATWSSEHATLANAQAAGFDANSLTSDPTLTATPAAGNSYSMAVNSGSPAINACTTGCSRSARGRYLANGTRDIGSHEFGATVVAPVGPSAGRAQ